VTSKNEAALQIINVVKIRYLDYYDNGFLNKDHDWETKMRKMSCFAVIFIFFLTSNSLFAYRFSSSRFLLTTDILELMDKNYQAELSSITGNKTSFSVRLGSYRTIEDSANKYPGVERRWELGAGLCF